MAEKGELAEIEDFNVIVGDVKFVCFELVVEKAENASSRPGGRLGGATCSRVAVSIYATVSQHHKQKGRIAYHLCLSFGCEEDSDRWQGSGNGAKN